MRNVLLVASLAISGTLAVACGSGDEYTLLGDPGYQNADSGAAAASSDDAGGGSTSMSTTATGSDGGEGGTVDPQDAGKAPPPPPPADAGAPPTVDVFTGAPAFVSNVASDSHNAGQNCMGGCHDHGFTFAGTLTDGNGNGVAGAEVRLVDTNGVAISVYTGSNGNFHSSTAFTAPAHVGARDAADKALMITALTASNGGCNGCHATGGAVAPIHLP
jgi:hypothetical protein